MSEQDTFSTSRGVTIRLRSVPTRLVTQIAAKYPDPDPPTYEAETLSGHVEVHPHDETTLETPEEWATWREYQTMKRLVELQRLTEVHKFLIVNCIAEDPPPPSEWGVDYEAWGLEPPDPSDKIAFKVRWVEEELCPDQEDLAQLLVKLYDYSGIQEDRIRAIQEFFRLALEGQAAGRLGRAKNPPTKATQRRKRRDADVGAGDGGVERQEGERA